MIQRSIHRTAPRTRSLALGGALAALAVVGGGTLVSLGAPTDVNAGDIRLAQNATAQDGAGQGAQGQEMPLGVAVNLDLEPVVARAAGGTIPAGTTVQVTGLPDGLTQDGWVISGTPTRAGEYEVLVTVSNSGVSKSQKVALTVTDGDAATDDATTTDEATAGAESAEATTVATATPGATPASAPEAGGAGEDADEADAVAPEGEATASPSVTEGDGTDGTDPTLSAAPGDPAQAGSSEEGAGDGTAAEGDEDENASPDLCAALDDGQIDGASLAQLLPMVAGDDESASSGMLLVILNTVVNLLPSVLGDSGSMGELGSAGEFLCTISPSLLGGGSGGAGADGTGTGTGTVTDTGTETGTGAAGLEGAPLALLGMLTNGAGSTGR